MLFRSEERREERRRERERKGEERGYTHIRGGTLVCSWAGEGDKLMTPFMNDKTTHWGEKEREGEGQEGGERVGEEERGVERETGRERDEGIDRKRERQV